MDIVMTVLHSRWDSNCLGAVVTVVLAAVHGSLGLPGWRLFRGFTLLSPFPTRPRPFSIGLLASVDVKQQKNQSSSATD